MYKLLIADDEHVIREGLRDIIDWNSLGFQPVAAYEDGQQVINYLKNDSVDVIITDIRMNIKSGLDVAKYVYEKKLSTMIILISGYKELDLAMSAIKYNVHKYILKPIDVDLLTESIIEAKSILDEVADSQLNNIALEAVKKGIEEMKDNFFEELMVGSFKNKNYINSMFHFLYPKLDPEQCSCFMATLIIDNYQDFIDYHTTRTNSELYNCLKNCINLASSEIEYRMITKNDNYLQLLGIVISQDNVNSYESNRLISSVNKRLCSDLKEILFIDCTITEIEIYNNISEVLHYKRSNLPKNTIDNSLMIKINEQLKMIYSTILTGNIDATDNLVKKLMNYLENLNFDTVHSIVGDLLVTIKNKLYESSIDISNSILLEDGFNQIQKINTLNEIETFLNHLFLELIDIVHKTKNNKGNLIEQAKKYITEHITEDISLEDISERFYISQYYFSRIFKSQAGENFIDFVVRKKMDYAITIIKLPQYKIYEISNIVGYKSNRYFCKAFKNYTGYSPSAYRKLL